MPATPSIETFIPARSPLVLAVVIVVGFDTVIPEIGMVTLPAVSDTLNVPE